MILKLLVSALVALLAVHWIFGPVLRIAKDKGLVDNPDARKLQKAPVPVLGGLAVFFGLISGCMVWLAMQGQEPEGCMPHAFAPVLLGASVMLYVGSLDDILGLSPRSRLLIEVLVMLGLIYGSGVCIDCFHGLWGIDKLSWWIAVPLTVFAGVGLINAYNMVDGVNGLSSGLCIVCSGLMAVICYKRYDFADSALAICFAGSLLPFFMHNVFGKSSKMFIGDAGTMVMGVLMTWFVMRILSHQHADTLISLATDNRVLGLIPLMLSVVCVPVFDTLRVMTTRMLKGRSPFSADKTHLHHAFIAVGMSHSMTTLCEIALNTLVVAIWYLTYRCGASVEVQLYVTVAASLLLVWGAYALLWTGTRENAFGRWMRRVAPLTHWGEKRWWLGFQQWLDAADRREQSAHEQDQFRTRKQRKYVNK